MTLHIVTGADDNYAPGVLVLIASAAWHNPGARFSVLDMGISPGNRGRIDGLGPALGVPVARIEIGADHFASIPVTRAHLTRSTYLRLLIPDLMPDEDRVVYMDCDMAVTDRLDVLAGMPLGDNIIAAVADPSPDARELAATGIARGDYVNAGLLVMNLPLWRREQTAVACIERLSDPARPLLYEDQSALNIVARGRILMLDPACNVFTDPAAWTSETLPQRLAVAHYVVNQKPWRARPHMGGIWRFHADRIAAFMPPLPPLSWKARLSALNRNRRVAIGLLMGRKKYRDQVAVAALMQSRFVAPYLEAQAKVSAR
ncbi:glycosyltransferase family 8 protein [Paracoccus sp. Z118]|uniref:glycosyltransferase family 8 protein n=1 Tax=Paracoccus sp. Z118 TaxID=2851017 RepID=UPI001C2BBF97|nr:glycosyltransferase family 8 protein [Paracoccus sp. Z118]MBV0892226.1 glycosyltransferase family 8 protein [Paracoccus sp. Z118]